jgi:hypothetical protein
MNINIAATKNNLSSYHWFFMIITHIVIKVLIKPVDYSSFM